MDPALIDPSRARRLQTLAAVIGAAMALAGGVVLSGWTLGIEIFSRSFPLVASMKANTSVGIVLSGTALWFDATKRRHWPFLLGISSAGLALLTVSQDIVGWNLRIDELIARDVAADPALSPGRMAPTTAICLCALGLALMSSGRRGTAWLRQVLAWLVVLIAGITCIGHLYEIPELYGVGPFSTMAALTAVMLLGLGVGLLLARPTTGLVGLLATDSLAGRMARRLMPVAVVAPAALGWVRLMGQRAGWYGTAFGVSLMVVSMTVTLSALIWWTAQSQLRVETDRRGAREALRVRQAETQAMLEHALDAVITMDSAGLITYWNRRAESVFGWSPQEAVGRDLASLLMPERYRRLHKEGLERFLATGEGPILGRRIEITAIRRDGREFPVELAVVALRHEGAVVFSAFVADITARKHAEDTLRLSERHKASLLRLTRSLEEAQTFSAVLEAALAEIREVMGYQTVWAYLLLPDGEQAALITIKGMLSEDIAQEAPTLTVKGDEFLEAIFASPDPIVVADARTDPRTNKEIVAALGNRTILNVRMSLADRHIGALGTGSFGEEGVKVPDSHHLDFFRAMAGDVVVAFNRIQLMSDRQKALEDVRALNAMLEHRVIERTAQLQAANQELEAFSYSVSHDLRAPLRHINGFSRILLEEHAPELGPQAARYLTLIAESAHNMGRMIDDLLQMARIERADVVWQKVDLNGVVNGVVEELKGEHIGRTVEWELGELPVVRCDAGLIKMVFTNLLSNAVKYTRKREPAIIRVNQQSVDGRIAIAVSDNGAGFDQRYARKLFGVFQRLHRPEEFEGTGVGLATVQRIIRKHGGEIWARGEVDKGAAFYLTLGSQPPEEATGPHVA